jgi:hypothetical protein
MIRVGSIVIRVEDLQRQTEFWEPALAECTRFCVVMDLASVRRDR